jgi:hypothetical protein
MSLINAKDQRNELQSAFNNKCLTDIAMGYIYAMKAYGFLNIDELRPLMKDWKKQRKEGVITIQEYNNSTKLICGKECYILTLQQLDANGKVDDTGLDICGLGFDSPYLITGHTYIFRRKENRDMVYKYVMGL